MSPVVCLVTAFASCASHASLRISVVFRPYAGIADHLAVNIGADLLNIVPGRVSTEVDANLSYDTQKTIDKVHSPLMTPRVGYFSENLHDNRGTEGNGDVPLACQVQIYVVLLGMGQVSGDTGRVFGTGSSHG
jgi:hypothetical protein